MRSPDNLDVGQHSLMLQEDTSAAKIWRYDMVDTWTHVATATQGGAETSGIVDVSHWFGSGWWALDVQSHVDLPQFNDPGYTWVGPPTTATGSYAKRMEDGQLLLMYLPGS